MVYFFIIILFRIDIPIRKQWRPWSDAAESFLRRLIRVCTVCLCPKNGTLGLYVLNFLGVKSVISNKILWLKSGRSLKTREVSHVCPRLFISRDLSKRCCLLFKVHDIRWNIFYFIAGKIQFRQQLHLTQRHRETSQIIVGQVQAA